MKDLSPDLIFFEKLNNLLEIEDYLGAINYIKDNKLFFTKSEDIALVFIICGFISDKLGEHSLAIDYFSKAILYEEKFEILSERSKDIPYCGRSNSKYRKGDFKGAIDDKRKARDIRSLEDVNLPIINGICIDFNSITSLSLGEFDCLNKYKILSKIAKLKKNKYDLIYDFKKVINDKKKNEVINKLEILSEEKYNVGDFKASINAIRRAEKYY